MRHLLLAIIFGSLARFAGAADAAPASATEIMRAVAANQDLAQSERLLFVYDQHVKVVVRRTNGKLAREEVADYLVTPGPKGVDRKQQSVSGKYWKDKEYRQFRGEPIPDSNNLDGSLAQSFRDDMLNDKSKDGLSKDLFPLTSDEQKDMKFALEGELVVEGRPAYRIQFGPADRNDLTWAGEAIIDKEDLEPVSIYTRLSRRIPMLVRTLLGTDLPGLGFSTQYRRLDKGVWFPVSFGTEFRLHAVFFINRNISVSMENRNFKRLSAQSEIHYDTPR